MAKVKAIYHGSYSLPVNSPVTGNIPVSDMTGAHESKCLIFLGIESDSASKHHLQVTIDASGKGLDYDANTTSFVSRTITYTVVEFASGVTVTHGVFSSSDVGGPASDELVDGTTVNDRAKAFVIHSGSNTTGSRSSQTLGALFIDASNDVYFRRNDFDNNFDVSYQIVEYDSANEILVQHGPDAGETDAVAIEATFGTTLDVNESVLVYQCWSGGLRGPDDYTRNVFFDDGDSASLDCDAGGADGGKTFWQAIWFKDGTTVKHSSEGAFAALAMADTVQTDNVAVSGNPITDSVWFPQYLFSGASGQNDSTNASAESFNFQYSWNGTGLDFQRGDPVNALAAEFSVITWNIVARETILGPAFIKRPWTKQPPAGRQLDMNNSLTKGLKAAYCPWVRDSTSLNAAGFNAVHNEFTLQSGVAGNPTRFATPWGIADKTDTSVTAGGMQLSGAVVTGQNPSSMMLVLAGHVVTTNNTLWGTGTGGSGAEQRLIYQSNVIRVEFTNGGFNSTFSVQNDNDLHVVGFTNSAVLGQHKDYAVWHDGQKEQLTSTSTIVPSGDTARFMGDGTPIGNLCSRSPCLLGCAWNRELSDFEVKSFHDNPWQIFKPKTIFVGKPDALNQRLVRF